MFSLDRFLTMEPVPNTGQWSNEFTNKESLLFDSSTAEFLKQSSLVT